MTTRSGFLLLCSVALVLIAAAPSTGQIEFSKPKAEKPLDNPLVISAARDEVRAVAKQLLESREIPLDKEDCNAQNGECILISKPIVFIKGIPTRSQLEHYCDVPAVAVRNWTRGRFTLRIHIAPASLNTAQVGVYAKFEGMPEGVLGTEWVVLASKGLLEDGLLRCIQQRTRGIECTTETR